MKVKNLSPALLNAACSLLSPSVQGLTSENLIQALKQYNAGGPIVNKDNVPRLLKIPEVADRLQVTTRTVENLVYRGDLIKVHCGRCARITVQSLNSFIQQQLEGGEA